MTSRWNASTVIERIASTLAAFAGLSAVSGVPSVAMPVFVGLVPPVPAKRAESQLMPGRTCVVCLFCILLLVSK